MAGIPEAHVRVCPAVTSALSHAESVHVQHCAVLFRLRIRPTTDIIKDFLNNCTIH